jgi:hypothetical protein
MDDFLGWDEDEQDDRRLEPQQDTAMEEPEPGPKDVADSALRRRYARYAGPSKPYPDFYALDHEAPMERFVAAHKA